MKTCQSLRDRLSTERALLGFVQVHPHLPMSEIAAISGYDFLLLDGEHGVFSEADYLHTLQVLSGTDALALIRLPKHDLPAVGRYLDMGADGIVVPNVSTAEQARALARAMLYPPHGTRGLTIDRVTRYGRDLEAYLRAPRGNACLLVIIESALGAKNAEDILGVDGVDGALIGPFDLSADLGCAGDFSQPAHMEAVKRIERAAAACGKIVGTGPHPGNPLEALVARGHRLLLLDGDVTLLGEAMSSQVTQARAALQR